jgi:copper homeostasis protein (lipoprotein)
MKRFPEAHSMRRFLLWVLLALPGTLLASPPAAGAAPDGTEDPMLKLQPLPASFAGNLPCADCPGIRYTLNLFPDQTYHLRGEYLGKEPATTSDDVGRWSVGNGGAQLVLRGNRERTLLFRFKEPDRLRKLDVEGREIESILNYDLVRESAFVPFEPRLRVRGMYLHFADAALLRECVTGQRFAVPARGDNLALEQAYLAKRREPGEELLVNAEVRMITQPRMDGPGTEPAVVVERFLGVWPGETCGTPLADAELTNTYWRLVRLGQEPVRVAADRREPHLRFLPGEDRVQGSTGCNRLIGSFERAEAKLRFGAMATTRMACEEDTEQEQALLQALEATRRFSIMGSHLELRAEDGRPLARFEATYF